MKPFINSHITPNDILNAVYLAADAIMEVYGQAEIKSEKKDDNSPVTIADIRAHNIIEETLTKSGWPILSEEGEHASYEVRENWDYFWVVDPLDGTKEFIKGNGEFTINIALVKRDAPIWGVVHSPVLDWTYIGGPKVGSLKSTGRLNYAQIKEKGRSLPVELPKKLTVVASRSHGSPLTESLLNKWEKKYGEIDRISMGSSLKICLVAEGEANIYPRLGPTMEWDTAAAHAIVNESNGLFNKYINNGAYQQHLYNKKNLLNDWFVVESNK